MRWKRLGVALVLGILCVCSLAGCGSQTAQEDNRKARITIVGWNIAAATFRDQAEAFEKANPDIAVDVQEVDDKYTRFTARMAAGVDIPDIVLVQNRDLSTFMNKYPDAFLDITDEVADYKDNYIPASWDAVTKDGKIYGVPMDMGPAALFYRADLWQQAGIDANAIETWDDFIAAGKKLDEHFHGEVSMTGTAEDSDFYDLLLTEAGGAYVSQDDKEVIINNEAGVKATEMYQKMAQAGIMRNAVDWDGRLMAMKKGQIASVPYGVWFAGTIESTVPDQKGNWKIMPLPAFEKGGLRSANSGGSVVAVAKNTAHPEAVMRFLDYAFNSDEGVAFQLDHGLFPAYMPIYNSSEFAKKNDYFGVAIYPQFVDIAKEMQALHRGPITLDTSKESSDFIKALLGGKDAKSALDEFAAQIVAVTGLSAGK